MRAGEQVIPADAALLRDIADRRDALALFRADPSKPTVAAARLRALADALEKVTARLTWMAHFADDPAGMANARTLHYDLTGAAKELLSVLAPAAPVGGGAGK